MCRLRVSFRVASRITRYALAALILCLGANGALANLGDDNDAIERAYEKIVERHLLDDGRVNVLYHKDKYLYFVLFDRGKSVLERYSRMDARELTQKEIDRFLKSNAGRGVKWVPDQTSEERRFERSDGKAAAVYGKIGKRPALEVRFKSKKEDG